MARLSLGAASRLRSLPGGARALDLLTTPLHRAAPMLVPRLRPDMELPAPAWPLPAAAEPPRVEAEGSPRRVVYFPSCLTRILGPLPGEAAVPLARAMLDVLEAGGFAVVLPPDIGSLCCGMPFASKAFPEAAREASARAAEALWTASRQGADPVVTDASPCAGTLQELAASYAERGVNLVRLAGGWTFRTAPDLASELKSERIVPRRLSRAAVETLAIIAYHQPATRRRGAGRAPRCCTRPVPW